MNLAPRASFIGCDKTFEESDVVIFGAPYDSTTSYRPGTRFGPSAMRAESFGIETYSMLQDRDLNDDARVSDVGDIELPFGDQNAALDLIEKHASSILSSFSASDSKRRKIPFLLGGEHLVSLGAVRAVAKVYDNLHIIHFDAHADLRTDYLGNPLSHACVMRRCHEIVGDGKIFQFGIRSGTRDEREFMREGHVTTELFSSATLRKVIEKIAQAPVYLTIDMDVLDPAYFPGTGTQEAHGMTYAQLLSDVREIFSRLNVVACDNVELNPMLDNSGRSTALACTFLREQLLSIF